MSNILSLSHTDLDGVGCQIVLYQAYGDLTIMNCGYSNLKEYINMIEDHLHRHRIISKVYITDLHFTEENFKQLDYMVELFHYVDFIYIDHHHYDFDYKQFEKQNLSITVDESRSATKITYDTFFRNHDENLRKFVDKINAYDIWLKDTPDFQYGLALNELFWSYRLKGFYFNFRDKLRLSNKDKDLVKVLFNKKDKLFKKLEDQGAIFWTQDKGLLLAYIDDFRSHITLEYPDIHCYVNITTYGSFSIRINKDLVPDEDAKQLHYSIIDYLLNHENVSTAGGHVNAMGGYLINQTSDSMMEIGKSLLEHIDPILTNIRLKN